MNTGNWDESDIQTDYFDVGWYLQLSLGNWRTHFERTYLTASQQMKLMIESYPRWKAYHGEVTELQTA